MTTIAELWILLVLAGIGFCLYAAIRLARRFSPGAVSAGPKTPPDSLFKEQSDTAEGLRTIEQRLDTRPGSMIKRIEASCVEVGMPLPRPIPGAGPEQHIDLLLSGLEAHLGLEATSHEPGGA